MYLSYSVEQKKLIELQLKDRQIATLRAEADEVKRKLTSVVQEQTKLMKLRLNNQQQIADELKRELKSGEKIGNRYSMLL